jgi:two-component system sensor histidine kinase/response regulator
LVVEDNLVCQRVVCKCLDRVGISYAVAQNGKVACDLVAAAPMSFDVVLMDLRMPVMDGITATQFIRREIQAKMPIVVFSAEVGEAVLQQATQAGATDFLPKPATPEMVIDMLQKYCPH